MKIQKKYLIDDSKLKKIFTKQIKKKLKYSFIKSY